MKTKKSIDSFDKLYSIEKGLDKVLGGGVDHSDHQTVCIKSQSGIKTVYFVDDCGPIDFFVA